MWANQNVQPAGRLANLLTDNEVEVIEILFSTHRSALRRRYRIESPTVVEA